MERGAPGRGISCHPPLWSAEAGRAPSSVSRRAALMPELLGIARETAGAATGTDPGFLGAT
ncbi:hypothetical protein GCM10009605_39590 [Nocardiopsis composta]